MKNHIFLYLVLPLCHLSAFCQQGTKITASVNSALHQPIRGVTVKIQGTSIQVLTDTAGKFTIAPAGEAGVLVISHLGYTTRQIAFNKTTAIPQKIILKESVSELKEVIVSTGYQVLPKERATGSFVQIGHNLLDRSVSTDILSRLQDVTSGLIFNRGSSSSGKNDISIRGLSTLYGNAQPLIVVDNFSYDGEIGNINPNDVESITVLKDAAAASIWGARAGNGVIVITTKKGAYNKENEVVLNSSVTIGKKPDLYYHSQMSSPEFIEIEKQLFSQGFYATAESSANHQALTPAVQLLIAQRDGLISATAANEQIEALKQYDLRDDLKRYFYRNSVNQQYAVSLSGGTASQRYAVSAGYDKNLDNLVRNGYDRVTFSGNTTYGFLKNRIQLTTGIYYVQTQTDLNNSSYNTSFNLATTSPYYPYAKLADAAGNPLPVTRDYQPSFLADAVGLGLLGWQYNPLQELQLADNGIGQTDYRLNGGLKVKILPGLSGDVLYQYQRGQTTGRNLQSVETYYTRNLINRFSQTDPAGQVTRNLPAGGIVDNSYLTLISQNIRGQLNYVKQWGAKNEFNVLAGYEIKDLHSRGNSYRLYGYDDIHSSSQAVNYQTQYAQYSFPGTTAQIPYRQSESDLTDRYKSYFANASYSYDRRYTVSGSARIDQSNLFGVKANQKGVPLWSAGFAWNINEEQFYHAGWLPYLKARLTIGFNGNVYKNISAYTTAYYYSSAPGSQLPYALILNPPNPDLRWERIRMFNLGLDFGFKNNVITGSVEYYSKKGLDLIGTSPYAPSTGILQFTGNNANTMGDGLDITLNSKNIDRRFKWVTNVLFSIATDKVTRYATPTIGIGALGQPIEGRPQYAIYSYPSAGLDPKTGDPQGYLNGEISKDYNAIINSPDAANIIYNGPARPTTFGSFRNTLSFDNFSVSANISFRLHYYFRKESVDYSAIMAGRGGSADFSNRWQMPGDETKTNIPSIPSVTDFNRDNFYLQSSALVEKGDNVRIQDVTFSYDLVKSALNHLPFKKVRLYLYANNIGFLWRANRSGLDPDFAYSAPPVRTIAAGLKIEL